ncbi:MAG: Ig-like domain repeat protein, partial [Eggerthellaceae bacterium]|nr:Ig-like domain repeat protein [Eggerthellaceae bacterium]
NLQDFLDGLAPESLPEFTDITIDNSVPTVSPIVVTPDAGNLLDDPYFASPCSVTIDIVDRFFSSKTKKKNLNINSVVATISYIDGSGNTQTLEITRGDFGPIGALTDYTFEYTTPMSFDTEACYTVSVNYIAANWLNSITAQRTFYIDCTPPTVDAARLYTTQASQLYHGIICEPSQAALELDLSDAVSGIDPAALTLTLGGVAYTLAGDPGMMSFTQDAAGTGNLKGTLRLELPADDSLALFAGVALAYADMSRNAGQASLSDLPIGYFDLDTQDPQATDYSKAEGIVVDSADPVLSVSYDNNDVRNGRYYNAPRTMAIELVEGTFYLVQAYQGTTVVATVSVGGADRKVTAKDFTNPSGDGVTWVYRFPCDLDGEYGVAASFTDPSGKGAAPFADGFIIDKTDPLIMVAFDNNSAQNGKYYKAPRTATVTVYEQNFSPALASIATSAGNGNAPGASGWTQAKAGVWQATVYFGQETSYALQVGCTDLAGNSAKQVSVPEFVIDMTAPLVSIERVDNLAAYAGEVEPLVKFSDLNFMAYLTDITITGALQGQVYSLASTEALTDTSRTVDYADFDYRLERDDVYTIDATIHDLAGNEAQATVTFSVNRFGSNYLYAPATEPLIGSYLKSAQQVVVSEVNVSGLSSSEVKLARNDSVRTLSEGTDYTVEQSGGQGEWSYYTYTFPKALFEDDGYYRILLSSHDAAGNFSDNLMDGKNADRTGAFVVSFAVDNTAPIATFANLMSNTTAFAPSRTVEIYANDNLAAAKATLIVNNQVVRTWDEEELADALVLSYDLPASEGLYTVRFEVRDKAGNTTTVSADNILVTNNLFLYIISTPGVLYPLIAGLILVIGTGAVIVNRVLARKRKKVTKRVEWQAFADGGGQASPRTR